MNEPQIVTPEEAQDWIDLYGPVSIHLTTRFAHTVATEHERRDAYARAVVVKALLAAGVAVAEHGDLISYESGRRVEKYLADRAGAIKNGADYA